MFLGIVLLRPCRPLFARDATEVAPMGSHAVLQKVPPALGHLVGRACPVKLNAVTLKMVRELDMLAIAFFLKSSVSNTQNLVQAIHKNLV